MATQTIRFEYVRSPKLRQRTLIETGVQPDVTAKVDLDLTTEPAELRRELVEALGSPDWHGAYDLRVPGKVEIDHSLDVWIASEHLVLDEDLTGLAQLRSLFGAWREAHAQAKALEPEAARQRAEHEAKLSALQEKRKREEVERLRFEDELNERKRAEAEAFEAERAAWAAEHGSEHLRRAVAAGYTCTNLYLRERAAAEYPGFTVDLKKALKSRSRACPCLPALDLVDALRAQHGDNIISIEIVWLTTAPRDGTEPSDDSDDGPADEADAWAYWGDWKPCEAVVVKDRRYRDYALVREM